MTYEEIVDTLNTDPFVQKLLAAPIPARLAYIGLDGTPRVVPVSYLWDGSHFVFASPPEWYKIKSIVANPAVAFSVDTTDFPPLILSVRGIATVEFDQGLPEVYVEASRRIVGEDRMPDWERAVRAENRNMALVRIKPTWIKVVDFETRYPGPN
ncbi:MAG: pyridoxamine 5'-phosphate oxidase family protein [Thermomicrobiales bacterium]|nr:pyridoxamine 5'-phosphate oxidase family protein [Thermomicrobiales bacterium]